MSGLFGGGPKAPPPVPTIDHAGVQAAGDAERRRDRGRTGSAASMLRGPLGVSGAANVGTKTLLGG